MSGWWFGTCFIFPFSWKSSSQLTNIFQGLKPPTRYIYIHMYIYIQYIHMWYYLEIYTLTPKYKHMQAHTHISG